MAGIDFTFPFLMALEKIELLDDFLETIRGKEDEFMSYIYYNSAYAKFNNSVFYQCFFNEIKKQFSFKE